MLILCRGYLVDYDLETKVWHRLFDENHLHIVVIRVPFNAIGSSRLLFVHVTASIQHGRAHEGVCGGGV